MDFNKNMDKLIENTAFYNLKSSYRFDLPEELIAQTPVTPRDSSRLLVCQQNGTLTDKVFTDVEQYLVPGDVLVVNESRVIPARLFATSADEHRSQLEILLLKRLEKDLWETLVIPGLHGGLGDPFLGQVVVKIGGLQGVQGRFSFGFLGFGGGSSSYMASTRACKASLSSRMVQESIFLPPG